MADENATTAAINPELGTVSSDTHVHEEAGHNTETTITSPATQPNEVEVQPHAANISDVSPLPEAEPVFESIAEPGQVSQRDAIDLDQTSQGTAHHPEKGGNARVPLVISHPNDAAGQEPHGQHIPSQYSPGQLSAKLRQDKLTFSSAPHTNRARPYEREDFSHSKINLLQIAHDNEILVHKLTDIGKKPSPDIAPPSPTSAPANRSLPCNIASSAVNRKKSGGVIAQQNLALYKRLQSVKPSKDVSRDSLAKSHHQNEVYSANCSSAARRPA